MDTKKEINDMCNLGEGLYNEGIIQGIEQGIIDSLRNLMKNSNYTLEEAISLINVPEKYIEKCRKRIVKIIYAKELFLGIIYNFTSYIVN